MSTSLHSFCRDMIHIPLIFPISFMARVISSIGDSFMNISLVWRKIVSLSVHTLGVQSDIDTTLEPEELRR